MSTILVTMATGNQGRGLVRSLLAAGMRVHALTRDASSPKAKELESWGATVFEGSFTDAASLARAVSGCSGVFLNLMPLTASGELNDAEAVLSAARASGTVKHVIYTSVLNADWTTKVSAARRDELLPPGGPLSRYFEGKNGVERAVLTADGFETATVLRPGTFMSNFLAPMANMMWPDLGARGVFRLVYDVDAEKFGLIDPDDIGKFATKAFQEPEKYAGKTVDISAENLSFRQIAAALEKASGKKVTLQAWTPEEVEKERGDNMLLQGQLMQKDRDNGVDLDKVKEHGIEMKSMAQFLEERKEEAVASVGPA